MEKYFVQSVIFDNENWNVEDALEWIQNKCWGFKRIDLLKKEIKFSYFNRVRIFEHENKHPATGITIIVYGVS